MAEFENKNGVQNPEGTLTPSDDSARNDQDGQFKPVSEGGVKDGESKTDKVNGGGPQKKGKPGNGKRTGGKDGRGAKGNGGPGGEEKQNLDDRKGLQVKLTQKTAYVDKGSVSNEYGKGASELKSDALSASEQAIGRIIVTEAEPTNLTYEGGFFIDKDNRLAGDLNKTNIPLRYETSPGVMRRIDAHEELIAIPSLPVAEESPVEYMSSQVHDSDTEKITVDESSEPIKGGQFLGVSIGLKSSAISSINLVDMTPAQLDTATFEDTIHKKTSPLAHYRHREQKVMFDIFDKVESAKKEPGNKNVIHNAPQTSAILITLMDIARDTTAILEKAIICSHQFMASIQQDRYVYGQDQNERFKRYRSLVAPILDFKQNMKKYNTTSSLLNLPYLCDIVYGNTELFYRSEDLWCYPKFTIALKSELSNLLRWRRVSSDHRGQNERNVLAFTTNFMYSDLTSINGEDPDTTHGIGGSVNRSYVSFKDGNHFPNPISHPVFDGINDMLKDVYSLASHPWGKDTEKIIPLTFDPSQPTFALLVMESMPRILQRLADLMIDFRAYVDEGGPVIATCCKYPVDNLKKFLNDAGYSKNNWHNFNTGVTTERTSNGNERMRFPEVAMLIDEAATDANSIYSYHQGFINEYTHSRDGEVNFSGRISFPAGAAPIQADEIVRLLDFVIATPNDTSRTSSYKYVESALGTASTIVVKSGDTTLGLITIGDWMKSRRIIGRLYSVPTVLNMSDTVLFKMVDGGIVNPITRANIKKILAKTFSSNDFSDLEGAFTNCKTGWQLSTHRLHFPIAIDDYKAAHIIVSNISGDDVYLKKCIEDAYVGMYKYNTGDAQYILAKDNKTTNVKPIHCVFFPFSWAEAKNALFPYLEINPWMYHAKFMRSYSNPFMRIREQASAGEDAPIHCVPHQIAINSIYYWYELDSSIELDRFVTQMDIDKDKYEASTYGV